MLVAIEPWHDLLPRTGGAVLSLFGGGGKTALLRAMSAALAARGLPVCLTTTTRSEILDWPELQVLEFAALRDGRARVGATPVFVRGDVLPAEGAEPEKWAGIAPADVDALCATLPEHVILVEADGSAGHPIKLHREDEPRLPARTTLAVPVLGLSCLGAAPAEVLHRAGRLPHGHLGIAKDAPWNWDHTLRLLAGYRARVPDSVPVLPALLQRAACADRAGLRSFLARALSELAVPALLLGELAGDAPSLQALGTAERGER